MLWNPSPGVTFGASDLARNALVSSFMSRSLRAQEEAYKDVWLDPLQRRLIRDGGKDGGGRDDDDGDDERGTENVGGDSVLLDDILRAFLAAEDARRRERPPLAASSTDAAAEAAASGRPIGPRRACAAERDVDAMRSSDAVPEKLKLSVGAGSPMWTYARFRSYVEEVALGLRAAEGGGGAEGGGAGTKTKTKPRLNAGGVKKNFDFTSSAPPPPPPEEEEEEEEEEEDEYVPITERTCRVVVDAVVAFAETRGLLRPQIDVAE